MMSLFCDSRCGRFTPPRGLLLYRFERMIEQRILPESRETWDKRGDEVGLSADFERSCCVPVW
jgi:hypothetical protein